MAGRWDTQRFFTPSALILVPRCCHPQLQRLLASRRGSLSIQTMASDNGTEHNPLPAHLDFNLEAAERQRSHMPLLHRASGLQPMTYGHTHTIANNYGAASVPSPAPTTSRRPPQWPEYIRALAKMLTGCKDKHLQEALCNPDCNDDAVCKQIERTTVLQ